MNALAKDTTAADTDTEIRTGAKRYKAGEWKKGEYLFLKANKAHWTPPNIDGVYWLAVPSLAYTAYKHKSGGSQAVTHTKHHESSQPTLDDVE